MTKAQRMINFQNSIIYSRGLEVAKEIANGEFRFSNGKIGRWMSVKVGG
jgi:hypothetical protein